MQSAMLSVALCLGSLSVASAQGVGGYKQEAGPEITLRKCTAPGSCKANKHKLTMDANWRWVHVDGDYTNCYKGNVWTEECPGDGAECAKACVLEGIDAEQYEGTYGVTTTGDGVTMNLVNEHDYGISVGARLYVLNGEDKYEMFKMLNQEFAFDAEMGPLECGINGAVYFIEMQENGGKDIGNNKAGAKYGTGYCDAQCPHDIKFIDGEANLKDWQPNKKDKSGNMGVGYYGACCNEMDIWEANARSSAYTPHPCSVPSMYRCEGTECGDNDKDERYKGVCDKDGCDFASWRMGARGFYGKGSEFTINTEKKLTQVTQFVTDDGTESGDLVEIRRVWGQDGKIIMNTDAPHMKKGGKVEGLKNPLKKDCIGAGDSLTDDICKSQNERFGDINDFANHGAHKVMGESLQRGHVLAISLWDDVDVSMMWLDSWFPRHKDKNTPGVSRGPCEGGSTSTPTYVRGKYPDAKVTYTNFAVGCLGCTTPGVDKGGPAYKPAPEGSPMCPAAEDGEGGGGSDDNDDGKEPSERRRRRTTETIRRRRRSGDRRRKGKGSGGSRRRRKSSGGSRRRKSR